MRYRAAIFDMDGTILNTIGDLTDSLNHVFAQTGHRHDFTEEDVRTFFGSGAHVAIQRALAVELGAPASGLEGIGAGTDPAIYGVDEKEVKRIETIFTPWYAAHCNLKTGPYAGIPEVIGRLRAAGVKTAVVSNKPDIAVQKLAEEIFPGSFDVSIGELPEVRRKPAPDMTDKALRILGVNREDAVYIGDSEVDMQTAEASGLPCISVSWGFRGRQFLKKHHASIIIDRPEELVREIL